MVLFILLAFIAYLGGSFRWPAWVFHLVDLLGWPAWLTRLVGPGLSGPLVWSAQLALSCGPLEWHVLVAQTVGPLGWPA